MISFGVIMDQEFANSVSQRRFSEEDHSLKAFRFQGAEKSLQMSVQIRACLASISSPERASTRRAGAFVGASTDHLDVRDN
jgi:hypothetical protein